jgi:hypothetical protein
MHLPGVGLSIVLALDLHVMDRKLQARDALAAVRLGCEPDPLLFNAPEAHLEKRAG